MAMSITPRNASRPNATRRVFGAVVCAVAVMSVATATTLSAQSRSKIITPAKRKTPAKFDFPKRYDGEMKQTKTAESQTSFFGTSSSTETLEAKLTWVEGVPDTGPDGLPFLPGRFLA